MPTTALSQFARASAAAMLLLCFVGFTTPACTSCEAISSAGLAVRVFDEQTGEPICGSSVIATDGDYRENMTLWPGEDQCDYTGAWDRGGTYRIVVSKEGYVTKTVEGVVVRTDECGHVDAQVIHVALVAE